MYRNVLVPTDGSGGTDRLLDHAIEIARDHDATVHGLYVVNKQVYLASDKDEQDEVLADLRETGERALAEVDDRAAEVGLDAVTELRDGVPHRAILDYVDDHGIDLVVMGTHGRTGRERVLNLGSVAEQVVGTATVPVLTLRIGGTEEADVTERADAADASDVEPEPDD